VTAMDTKPTSPSLARRRVARTVRDMREQAGLRLVDAASRLDLSRSALNRMESGATRVSVHLARSMMDVYDHYSPELLDTIRVARSRGWWQEFGLSADDYVGWETGASHVREVATARIPALLQTEDYARALLTDHQDAALTVLKIRQHQLANLRLSVVLAETALHNDVGGSTVTRTQQTHLLTCATSPTISVRVLPAATVAYLGTSSFRLLEFDQPDDPPVLFTDTVVGTRREDKPRQTRLARDFFDTINQAAVPY
jgi:DNA-binding XRE family transcriptional regulator